MTRTTGQRGVDDDDDGKEEEEEEEPRERGGFARRGE